MQHLVDAPNETLAVEYKEWLDLKDNAVRAGVARHIAALANSGGGMLVFGISDDMTSCGDNPFIGVPFDRDAISSIVRKFLEPAFQCDVVTLTSESGVNHAVVVVPPHGASPICAKAGGPEISPGKPAGITRGVYYTRKPGPESAAIETATEWAPVIRRCAMHDRAGLLAALDATFRGANAQPAASRADELRAWHDAAHAAYLKDIARHSVPAKLATSHWQLSYAIEANGETLPLGQLRRALEEVNNEVHDLIQTGWSMFHIFDSEDVAARFRTDPATGDDEAEFLECSFVRADGGSMSAFDMWRVSPDGKATLLRDYWEDHLWSGPGAKPIPPDDIFDPNLCARSLAELVRHARGLTERFTGATEVSFRCEWFGLAGRQLGSRTGRWTPRKAGDGHRVVSGSWPVAALANEWPDIVATLIGPVARNFQIDGLMTAEWMARQSGPWHRL